MSRISQFWIDYVNGGSINEEFKLRDSDKHVFTIPHYHYTDGKNYRFSTAKNIVRDEDGQFAGLDGKPGKFDFN